VRRLPELGSGHRRFPDLPLLCLAVAHDAVDAGGGAGEPQAERHPERDRESLAERAGGRLDPGQRRAIGMPLEPRAELAEREQLRLRQEAGRGHHSIEGRHAVALGEHDPVAVGPVGASGIDPQAAHEEGRQDVDDRERAARVPGAGVGQHPDDLDPAGPRDRLNPLDVGWGHQESSSMNPAISSARMPAQAISGV
jgi:hypothetical protein